MRAPKGQSARRRLRRAGAADDWPALLNEGLVLLQDEDDTVHRAVLFCPQEAWALVGAAAMGSKACFRYGLAIEQFGASIKRPVRGRAHPCGECGAPLSASVLPHAIAIMHAEHEDPCAGAALGFCPGCTARIGDRGALKAAAAEALCRRFPKMRVLHGAGGAGVGHA